MISEYDNNEVQEAITDLIKHMALVSIQHLDKIDVRTITVLYVNDYFKGAFKYPSVNEKTILPLLYNKEHPYLLSHITGPILFQRDDNNKKQFHAAEIINLLLNDNVNIRKAAFFHFEQMLNKEPALLNQRSKEMIIKFKNALNSSDIDKWGDAAINISDAIQDDWLCNLSGVKQCLAINDVKGLEKFLTLVLRPSISSIESIGIGIWAASEQKEKIEEFIFESVLKANDLEKALNSFYYNLGHLPLCNDLSIGRIITEWKKHKRRFKNTWDIVWKWADSINSPLPRFHASQFFANNKKLIKRNSKGKLLDEILEIICVSKKNNADLRWQQAWKLRCELARHYCHYLECRLPGSDSERVAAQSWWLAEQVSMVFDSQPEAIKELRKITIKPEGNMSYRIWELAHPILKSSDLSYATKHVVSLWSLALLTQVGNFLKSFDSTELKKINKHQIENAICSNILGMFPIKPKKMSKVVYSFDRTVMSSAKVWVDSKKNTKSIKTIKAFINGIQKITKKSELKKNLLHFPNADAGNQVFIATAFHSGAHSNVVPEDLIWEFINDKDKFDFLLLKSEPLALELFFKALIEIQIKYGAKWAYLIPHLFATGCEAVHSIPDRRRILFALTLLSSISSDSTSAIERLLKGKQRKDFSEDAKYWKDRIKIFKQYGPRWIQAKLRATAAILGLAGH